MYRGGGGGAQKFFVKKNIGAVLWIKLRWWASHTHSLRRLKFRRFYTIYIFVKILEERDTITISLMYYHLLLLLTIFGHVKTFANPQCRNASGTGFNETAMALTIREISNTRCNDGSIAKYYVR